MIIMKFGGTSLESAAAIERVASIVRARVDRRPVVVVSAMGKTTHRLLAIGAEAAGGRKEQALEQLGELQEYHRRESRPVIAVSDGKELDDIIEQHFRELSGLVEELGARGELTPRSSDAIASYGERLSSLIVALAFRNLGLCSAHLDARSVIVTDQRHTQAAPLYRETYARLAAAIPPLAHNRVVVLAGYIGASLDGVTTTLGRGGSDFTASIVGAGVGAEEIQIWTDVDGMLTCDPTLVQGVHRVKMISFAEAAELAYFGAKVLHPATLLPAAERNIPVLILNSRRPEAPGTHSRADPELAAPRGPRNAHRSRARPVQQRHQVDCLQEKHHRRQHPVGPDVDGPRLPAADLRGLRPLRDACGHAGHLRSQRLAHD